MGRDMIHALKKLWQTKVPWGPKKPAHTERRCRLSNACTEELSLDENEFGRKWHAIGDVDAQRCGGRSDDPDHSAGAALQQPEGRTDGFRSVH